MCNGGFHILNGYRTCYLHCVIMVLHLLLVVMEICVECHRLFLDSIMFILGSSSNDRVVTSLLSYRKGDFCVEW